MGKYTVTVVRAGAWWVLQAVEAPGAISQVASLDDADQVIEAIAFVTGERAENIEIRVKRIFAVTVTQEGPWWKVTIPELGGLTQAADLADVPLMAQEYIAVTLDIPREGVEVRVRSV